MATVIVMLKRHYQKKDGSFPVVLQVNSNSKQKYIYTGYSVTEDQWDDRKWVKRSNKDCEIINQAIEDKRRAILDRVGELEKSGKPITVESICRPSEVRSFSSFLRTRLKYFTDKGNINMEYKINADIREIELVNRGEVFYTDIDVPLLKKLEVHLRQIGNHQNTIARKFKNFRTHYKAATLEDNAPLPNPFELVKIKKQPVKRNKLTYEQVEAIEKLKLTGKIKVARDMFLFSLYCQGMRFENVLKLRKDQIYNGGIHYKMNKGLKYRSIGFHPKLQSIINEYIDSTPGRYLFPLLLDKEYTDKELYQKKGSENSMINACLKQVGIISNTDPNLMFHQAKHAFAWIFKTKKGGQDMDVLKDALGHSNYQVMESYLKSLDDGYIDEKVKDIF